MFGLLGFAFWKKRDPLEAGTNHVLLHRLASVSVPATFELQPGIWNYNGWYASLKGRFPLVEPERAVDRAKVTFAFSIEPRTDPGGNPRDDGELFITLYRDDPGHVDPNLYFEQLYPDRQLAPRLRPGEAAGGWEIYSTENQYFAAAFAVHRQTRRAGYIKVNEGVEELTRRMLLACLDTVVCEKNMAGTALNRHFAEADAFPERVHQESEEHLRLSNAALRKRGFPPLEFGRPSWFEGEAFCLLEEPHPSGASEWWLRALRPVTTLSVREGRWLEEKLDERHELGGLVFVFWSSEMSRWETSGHGAVTQEVLSHFALRGLDPFSAYVYHVYRWPLHSGPWTDDSWVAHLREIDDARRRIDVLRPYFKRLRSRGLPSIQFDLSHKKDQSRRPLPLFPVRKVRKWGYKNSESKMVVDFSFSEAQPFSEGLAWVRRDDRWIALTLEGNIGIELEVESVERVWPFVGGWARFRRGRMEQVYNYDGERPILERLFVGYYNSVNSEGKLMHPVGSEEEFTRAENFRGPFAWVQTRSAERIWIDAEGKRASEGEIKQWRLENNDWSVAGSYLDGFRFVDPEGKVLLELPKGTGSVRPFHDNLAAVWVENQGTGYMDRKGQFVIPPQYAYGQDFSQGLAAVCPDSRIGLWTYIDVKGRPIAAPEFSEAQPFHGGLALVKKNLYYYLDQGGRLLLPPGME